MSTRLISNAAPWRLRRSPPVCARSAAFTSIVAGTGEAPARLLGGLPHGGPAEGSARFVIGWERGPWSAERGEANARPARPPSPLARHYVITKYESTRRYFEGGGAAIYSDSRTGFIEACSAPR